MFKMFVCAIAVAATMMVATPALAADEIENVSVNDKMYDVDSQEYGAICAMLGGEPELSDVTIQEYLMVCRAWKGHAVLAAERVTDYVFVEDDSYWSSPITKTSTGHTEVDERIVAVDDHGNTFTYHL